MQTMHAQMQANPATAGAPAGIAWVLSGFAHHFGNDGTQQIVDAIVTVRAAGVPWLSILGTILTFAMTLFTGGKIDLAAIIKAILALIPTPAPAS